MSIQFRGTEGFNRTFSQQKIAQGQPLKDGTTAPQRLGDGIVSPEDRQALKASYVEQAVAAGATPEQAEAEFNHFLADALDGQVDDQVGAGTQDQLTQMERSAHTSEPLALQFRTPGTQEGTATPPSLVRLKPLENPNLVGQDDTRIESSATPTATTPNPGESPQQPEINRFNREIGGLNQQITRRNGLQRDVRFLQDQRRQVEQGSNQITRYDDQGRPKVMTKQQVLADIDRQITTIRQELAPLEAANLDRRVLQTYEQALKADGPVNTRMKDVLAEIGQLRSDPEFASTLQAIETAAGNRQTTVTINGQTRPLAEVTQDPRFQRLSALTQELHTLGTQTHTWGQYIPSGDQERLNKAGAQIQSRSVVDAALSKAGIGELMGIPVPIAPTSSGWQAGKDAAHNLMGFFGTAWTVMPDSAKTKLVEIVTKLSTKYGPQAMQKFGEMLASKAGKISTGMGRAFAVYGAAYYGSIAAGMNYPNVELGKPPILYELRPSPTTRGIAAAAATLDGLSVGLPPGFGEAAGLMGAVAEVATEFSLLQDQEILEVVDRDIIRAETGAQMREGLARINASYGGMAGVQQVLGQVGVHQGNGQIAYVTDDQSDVVDRDLAGAVANRILQFGAEGKIGIAEAQTALKGLMGGTSERWFSGDNVSQSFVNQIFLTYGQDKQQFERALQMLGSDVRLQLFKSLDSGITWGETSGALNWLLEENSTDLSEAKVMEYLAGVEKDPVTQGRMVATLFDGFTRGRFEDLAFNMIENAQKDAQRTGNFKNFNRMLSEIRLDGNKANRMAQGINGELSPDRAGRILAWMVKADTPAAQVNSYIREMSGKWFSDDKATMHFLDELKTQGIQPAQLRGKLDQNSIKLMLDNLQQGWTTNTEYRYLTDLAAAADANTRNAIMNDLMDWNTVTVAERAMADIFTQASDADLRTMLSGQNPPLNMGRLAGELEDAGAYRRVASRLGSFAPGRTAFDQFTAASGPAQVSQTWRNTGADARNFTPEARLAMFKRMVDDGNLQTAREMLFGRQGVPAASTTTRNQMFDYLASRVDKFSRDGAAEATSWILSQGSQAQTDTAFKRIQSTGWFGSGGQIVKSVMDKANAQGLDIRGKLSMNTLQAMVGSLNNTWTKMFGDYQTNVNYIRQLANVVDLNGKVAIVDNLMTGWTKGEAETLIHDIFRDTPDRREFTQLVDRIGPARISSELEERSELGKVMAYVIERYDSGHSTGRRDDDAVLNQIMNQWSSTSIKSDDVIWHMLKQLERDGKMNLLKSNINNGTLNTMIDWTDDAFRDGNVWNLDPESAWSVRQLEAAR
jgi:hypothetical protein